MGKNLQLKQPKITIAALEAIAKSTPRRMRIDRAKALRPGTAASDPCLSFRFPEKHRNLMATCPVDVIAMSGNYGSVYAYLKEPASALAKVEAWLDRHHGLVACRDLLAVSLAVDFDREDGDPDQPQTLVGKLRTLAKTYGARPTKAALDATQRLADTMASVVRRVDACRAADIVVAMPPSQPDPPHHLTRVLAQRIAAATGIEGGADTLRTTTVRPGVKGLCLDKKFAALEGTFTIDTARVRGRAILLVDDLYQSGISMNFVAMKLQGAGARAILGLAAEKTCRNDDNARAR